MSDKCQVCVEVTPVDSLCEDCLPWYKASSDLRSNRAGTPSTLPCDHSRDDCLGEIKWADSCTMYPWYPAMRVRDPNTPLPLCTRHSEEHYAYWKAMWDEASDIL